MKSVSVSLLLLLIIVVGSTSFGENYNIKTLDGNWEGAGRFVMPGINTEMELSGSAIFQYNEEDGYLRTELMAEKFLFTYSDSGHLIMDASGDSLTWEVWNSFNRYYRFRGMIKNNIITGTRKFRNKIFDVTVEIVHLDSIDVKVVATDKEGTKEQRAKFHLWRVE